MKNKLLSSVAAGCVVALLAVPALATEARYQEWQPDQQTVANQELIDQLRAMIREAESARAADPRFLDDLKALANEFDPKLAPRQAQQQQPQAPAVVFQDDFRDGDFTRGVNWSVYQGQFWVEEAVGLRTIVRETGAQPVQQQQTGQQDQQDVDEGDLAKAIIGDLLNRTLNNDGDRQQDTQNQQQPSDQRFLGPAEIRAWADIPNTFTARLEITSRERTGALRFGPMQGRNAEGPGYHVQYRPADRDALKLIVVSSRGERQIGVYTRGLRLEDGRLHVIELTRTSRGQMTVSLDGTPLISVDDNSLRDPFQSFVMVNHGGDYAFRNISIKR